MKMMILKIALKSKWGIKYYYKIQSYYILDLVNFMSYTE